jgi:hypothetical protein
LETVEANRHADSNYANGEFAALQNPVQFNADLQQEIKAWETLPEARCPNIVAIMTVTL